jgi:ESS family glutamate:Na+ symporter
LYPNYYYAGFISMFGMLTGTISSGVLLLREVDSDFETPAANNLLLGSSFAILFGAPILALVGMAPNSPGMTFVTLGILLVYLALLLLVIFKAKRRKA